MIVPDVHLGEIIAALVDGELSSAARDRALAHATGCAHCRAALDEERCIRARLRLLADGPGPVPDTAQPESGTLPPGLFDRLAAISTTHPATSSGRFPSAPVMPGWPQRLDHRRGPGGQLDRRHPPGPVRRAVAVTSAVVAGCVAVIVLGSGASESGPTLVPVGALVDRHDATVREVPLYDPAVSVVMVGLRR